MDLGSGASRPVPFWSIGTRRLRPGFVGPAEVAGPKGLAHPRLGLPMLDSRSAHDPDRGSFVFGVIGGIAAGKSEVARLLAGPGGLVLDADRLAREELESPAGRERLLGRYGPGILGPDGRPDRAALSERLFGDPGERRWVEGWIHPAVGVRMDRELAEAQSQGRARIVLDIPLLLESEAARPLSEACDALVFVEASSEVREARVRRSRGWPLGELARREAAQLDLERKRARADHVIENQGDLASLAAAVRRVLVAHGLA